VRFFTRLIWQESRFDPSQVSPAGAQGIAQFMPPTAAARGLADPFDPVTALQESASYLRELRNTFGNLGLAAAAYNAGAYRVSRWLSHAGSLPDETVDYVQIVTGRSVGEWAAARCKMGQSRISRRYRLRGRGKIGRHPPGVVANDHARSIADGMETVGRATDRSLEPRIGARQLRTAASAIRGDSSRP
jgi:membrane-bound lytic murein transglycosylase MltF